ncbi:MAG: acetolactate synthase small subunit [Porphyromonadaceae bacterium]|nr:acetolactate synthase small subunit [Porphyromonadaceae bacterium]MCD8287338.1 acetolactate synthase small subunit [Porphyromonadaceae bacterium]
MEKKLYTIIVYSENIAGLLNQITAVFTRRQINIESLNVSASSIKGVHKYTITVWIDEETIKKIVLQIEKKIEVLQAHYFTDEEIFSYEVALYKLSTPVLEREPGISKLIRRYNARVVEINPTYSAVEKDGMTEDITSFYDELQKFGCVLQFVRSGRVALTKSCVERVNEFLADRKARYLQAKQAKG